MPRVQVGYAPDPAGLQVTAQPNIATEQARLDPGADKAFQLANALGVARPSIEEFNRQWEAGRQQEQLLKEHSYREIFRQNNESGEVSAAQARKISPELVPVVAARVAEGIGLEDGRQQAQPAIDAVMQQENLRLSTADRVAFLKQKRDEFLAGLRGDDFYKSGALKAWDNEVNQYENAWQRQTADYHQQIQAKQFSDEVTAAISSPDTKTAMLDLDTKWKSSSSLSNLERNKLVIDTVTKQAFATDNPSLLDKIPVRFLNADTRAEVERTRLQIQQSRMTQFNFAKSYEAYQREEQARNAKLEILEGAANGQPVDIFKYRNNPEAFAFALANREIPRLPETTSVATSTQIKNFILAEATVRGLNPSKVIDEVMKNPNMNPKEKQSLIAEVPKLVEGSIAMNDDAVRSAMTTRLDARLRALESSSNAQLQSLITGTSLRSDVMRSFDITLRNGFQAFYEENKTWPTGRAKQDIVDKATESAEKLLSDLTSVNALKRFAEDQKKQSQTTSQAPAGAKVKKFNPATGKIE
jgi:hypothetical protein